MYNRRNFVKQGALATGAMAFLRPLKGAANVFNTRSTLYPKTLTILHTSDLQSGTGSFINSFFNPAENLSSVYRAVKKIRSEHRNVVLLNNGNLFNASAGSDSDHAAYFKSVRQLNYTAIVPGNKDVENGADYFARLTKEFQLNVVATNVENPSLLPYQIIKKGDLKVGIIGLACAELAGSNSANTTASVLSTTAAYLKQQQDCHLVMCLSYNNTENNASGIKSDMALAAVSTGIDVILSGNNNTDKKITRTIRNAEKQEVLIASSGIKGSTVGRIDITFNEVFLKTHVSMSQIKNDLS